ncbi:putative aldo/keto reductase family protein [Lyophyllum shimeji]|uniref:Aldo/keto reductase family protein n=1 Tax=Lyophyllum shimeji TaxID=47721 RepID=A0A9P3PVT0_LYOSH|nr:putative aldo/keto reductase family protein [Lyophyllum shimeji]
MQYVRLGNSGLKVSCLILGTISYGTNEWQPSVIGEEEGWEHIKIAQEVHLLYCDRELYLSHFRYDAGVDTFDTANVYSNGLLEEISGKAIKKFNLPRDELVVMSRV